MTQKVLGLVFVHENRVLEFTTEMWCGRFAPAGYAAEVINMTSAEGLHRLQENLESGEVAFCFGLQGVGSRLATQNDENLWTHYKTPFLGLHHDSPACNIYNHFCDSRFVANIYFFGCQYDVQKRFVKNAQINEKLPFEIEWVPPVNTHPFAERPIRMSFVKSGQSPKIYADNINSIKAPLRDAVWAAIEKTERNENLILCDLLTEAFTSCGIDAGAHWKEFWGFADWMENYIRTKRATDLVNWLKYQEGAVIVGNGWDFIDKTDAKAVFKPAIAADHVHDLYCLSQFMFNTSPYGADIIHERVFQGLGLGCYTLSDTNRWWDGNFANVPQLHRFHWGDDLATSLSAAINDPRAADKAMSDSGIQRINEKLYGNSNIPRLIEIAAQVRGFGGVRI